MRSLFLKIFLWFWGAMIAIGLTLFLVITTVQPDPLPEPWRDSTGAVLSVYGSSAVSIWEQKGQAALSAYLLQQESKTDYRLHLCDENGRELSGRQLDNPRGRDGRAFDRGEGPRGDGPALDRPQVDRPQGDWPRGSGPPGDGPLRSRRDGPPPQPPGIDIPFFGRRDGPRPPDDWNKLNRLALQSDETIFELSGPRVLATQKAQSGAGRRYILQAVIPRPRFGRPAAEPGRQLIGVLLVLAMSGLVCYGLVRYLTAPMVALREATQQLAGGNLAARTGAAERSRRDEVADLGRDFDAMAEQIETLIVSQRRLLGDISHELRSPLARLGMALALARRHVAQGASAEEIDAAFHRIKRETVRLNDLIEQLLQLARLDSEAAKVDAQELDLKQLVHDVVADADFEARATNRAVGVLQSDECRLTGSPSLLTSALENVVRNAIRYTAPNTTVEVSLQHIGHEIVMRVHDYGPGVPDAALGDLFRPFFRVADARDRDSGGVGLGLAITERAITSHGGHVSAHNAPGGGLLVELFLPAPAGIA